MDKIYRIVVSGRPTHTKFYKNLGSARNAFSNTYGKMYSDGSMHSSWIDAEIQSAAPVWHTEDVIKTGGLVPWHNSNLIRVRKLRADAERMLAEADSLEKLNGLFHE